MNIEGEAKDIVLKRLMTPLKFVSAKTPEAEYLKPSSYIIVKPDNDNNDTDTNHVQLNMVAEVDSKPLEKEKDEILATKSKSVNLADIISSYSNGTKTNRQKEKKAKNTAVK